MTLRVTFASYDDSPPLGGQGVMLQGMRAALKRRGVLTHTVAGRGDHAVRYPTVLRRAPLDLSLYLNQHPSMLMRGSPDVVHAHGGPGGVLLLRRPRVPLVYTAHHTYAQAHPRGSAWRLPAPLEARSYRLATMVLPVSPSTAAAVRAMGIPSSRIEVVPPGVDVPEADDAAREAARVLFVGRLRRDKGVLDAIDVMRALVEERADVRGVVIGDGALADEVRARVGREPRIEIRGAADASEVKREYARASLLLVPSRYEGLGLVALEGQAAGTPVVGYDVDGLRHAVVDGGVLVPAGDAEALRAAAVALLQDDARRRELGERGRAFVRERHSWDRTAERLEQIYAALAHA
ncbi:MAG: glycosyltransferase family 4 protein [Candidatus Dormibacteraeota bacterium]|nr:glycosyltransferase family 4 protein [Candidatus Dormibacteraeota bacterium]